MGVSPARTCVGLRRADTARQWEGRGKEGKGGRWWGDYGLAAVLLTGEQLGFVSEGLPNCLVGQISSENALKDVSEAVFVCH